MATPSRGPFSNWGRAVQAYALSLGRGGSAADAEAAISRMVPDSEYPRIAAAARGAIEAARALNEGGELADALFGAGALRSSEAGADRITITVRARMRLDSGAEVWKTVQVDAPYGADMEEAQSYIDDAIQSLTEEDEYGYAGDVVDTVVATVIGHTGAGGAP